MGATFCGGLLVALFGGGFIFVGVQTLTGAAKDTLGNGIGSIIFAALMGGFTVLLLVALGGVRAVRADTGPVWAVLIRLDVKGLAANARLAGGLLARVGP